MENTLSNASVSLLNTRGSFWLPELPMHPAVEKSSRWPDLRGMSACVQQSDGWRGEPPTPLRAQRWRDSLSHLQPFPLKLRLSRSEAAVWLSSYPRDVKSEPTGRTVLLLFVQKHCGLELLHCIFQTIYYSNLVCKKVLALKHWIGGFDSSRNKGCDLPLWAYSPVYRSHWWEELRLMHPRLWKLLSGGSRKGLCQVKASLYLSYVW